MKERELVLDEGYQFGLGVFETIAVEHSVPLLLEEHLRRMERSLQFLGTTWKRQGLTEKNTGGGTTGVPSQAVEMPEKKEGNQLAADIRRLVCRYLDAHPLSHGALKIMVSAENTILTHRRNPYTPDRYAKGFQMDYSGVLRNETSPLVFHKTLNYGDCILEKRRAAADGVDELIFLNTKGQLCEGTATNLFLIKNGKLYTPEKTCGLLPGIMRDWVMRSEPVEEAILLPEQAEACDECFVTNSLMGIMPVARLGQHRFLKRDTAERLLLRWQEEIRSLTRKKD